MKKNVLASVLFAAALMLLLINCSKPASNLHIPPSLVHFIGNKLQAYPIEVDPAPVHTIDIGVTDVSEDARTITLHVTSPTGAVEGTQYTIVGGHTITLGAGKANAQIQVQGMYSQYSSGRRDTLVFTITDPGIPSAPYGDTVRLVLRGTCFDGNIGESELQAMLGQYENSNDDGFGPFGPYTTTIKSATLLTATTARVVINNVWADDFGDVNFIFDWTDPTNTTTRVENETVVPADAGILNPAYGGLNLVIADHDDPGSASNIFSVCTNKVSLRYMLGVYDPGSGQILGYFPNVATTTMER